MKKDNIREFIVFMFIVLFAVIANCMIFGMTKDHGFFLFFGAIIGYWYKVIFK